MKVGSDDPDTLVATGNLAGLYVRMGKDELALPLRIRALEAQRRILGQRHPHTLVAAGTAHPPPTMSEGTSRVA